MSIDQHYAWISMFAETQIFVMPDFDLDITILHEMLPKFNKRFPLHVTHFVNFLSQGNIELIEIWCHFSENLDTFIENDNWKLLNCTREIDYNEVIEEIFDYNPLLFVSRYSRLIHNSETILKILIKHKCNIDAENKYGVTAIMLAAGYSHSTSNLNTVELLIRNKCDINLRDKRVMWNALQWGVCFSSRSTNIDTIQLLLDNLVEIDNIGLHGSHSLTTALEVLMSTKPTGAFYNNSINTVTALIMSGASLDNENDDGYNALMFAADIKNHTIINLLLDQYIDIDYYDINIKNEYGITPLMCFASNGLTDATTRLLANGADTEITDQYGRTAIFLQHLTSTQTY